jgi:hypothetical protein
VRKGYLQNQKNPDIKNAKPLMFQGIQHLKELPVAGLEPARIFETIENRAFQSMKKEKFSTSSQSK